VIGLLHGNLNRNQVVLETQLGAQLASISGDRVQLQQVILNLMLNATEAMSAVEGRPRSLRIASEQVDGAQVCITVCDAGVGLPGDDAGRLFEPFYTTKANGLGIGLSICRSIIEGHKGRLWAQPNAGDGASFLFTLPCSPRER
jgi:signal transduction histidine kinase